ncbi:unnamed protein product [Ilex paraguariensis]|uniref:Uncharacterized protein n=1 Tax=Ilex paraguariensis TaxID=185542 RepID=A0ABC8US47_9AQUA
MGGVAVLQTQELLKDRLLRPNLIYSPNLCAMQSRRNPNPKPNPNPSTKPNRDFDLNPKPNPNCPQRSRKWSSTRVSKCGATKTMVPANQDPKNALVMGQVKILKRGEVLEELTTKAATRPTKDEEDLKTKTLNDSRAKAATMPMTDEEGLKSKKIDDFVLSSTDRLGPEPDILMKQFRITNSYAGSAFVNSPPPSSLPVPAFFRKRSVSTENSGATSDLRQILGLDVD